MKTTSKESESTPYLTERFIRWIEEVTRPWAFEKKADNRPKEKRKGRTVRKGKY